ncbi:UPF0223 family protein [Streptococcus macacae]|uniref:UPF0223 protein STRMA_0718 n=1 Tax=Streptococcus macacae NCTC 11558 TaxID=764298 RepID=G5JVE4_9STRE|nr:UPF0223 family protein [Streptococcus macacae]EHJ52034.1 hypothetical protein STRMA_0718 [Streptococcus macacae NCTC 11558]SUN78540.1 hypothetical cytosolic protein [Streptococcus macacae NCTC 11558]
MPKNYAYPLDVSWSTDEIASVLSFLNQVEKAYESKVDIKQFLESYKAFKEVVRSKAQEKQIGREFEKNSGYSIYCAVQAAKAKEKGFISLGK